MLEYVAQLWRLLLMRYPTSYLDSVCIYVLMMFMRLLPLKGKERREKKMISGVLNRCEAFMRGRFALITVLLSNPYLQIRRERHLIT